MRGTYDAPKRKQLEKAKKRIQELDRLLVRTYEDNVSGKLSDERFAAMSRGYEDEQQDLKEAAETLRKEIEVHQSDLCGSAGQEQRQAPPERPH